jgi:cytochrome P450
MNALARHVGATIETGDGVLPGATSTLTADEVVSNAAVMMFGGIETSEGMTTSLFWHLLTTPGQWMAVTGDPSLLADENGRGFYAVSAVDGGAVNGAPAISSPTLPTGWVFRVTGRGVRIFKPRGMTVVVR